MRHWRRTPVQVLLRFVRNDGTMGIFETSSSKKLSEILQPVNHVIRICLVGG
jgi:hypothetical protein